MLRCATDNLVLTTGKSSKTPVTGKCLLGEGYPGYRTPVSVKLLTRHRPLCYDGGYLPFSVKTNSVTKWSTVVTVSKKLQFLAKNMSDSVRAFPQFWPWFWKVSEPGVLSWEQLLQVGRGQDEQRLHQSLRLSWLLAEMEKRADTADISVLFFFGCAIFLAVYAQRN